MYFNFINYIAIILILLHGCSLEKKPILSANNVDEFIYLKRNVIPFFLKDDFRTNWMERYSEEIQSKNPELLTIEDGVDSFLIIPALNIPIDSLSDFDGNIFNYFRCGEFSLNNGEIWVFRRDTLRAKYHIIIRDNPEYVVINSYDFSPNLKKTQIGLFKDYPIYFKTVIRFPETSSTFFLPGIYLKDKGQFNVFSHGMELYSLKDQYKIMWKSQKGFEQYIYKIIEADSIMKSMPEYDQ